MSYMSHGTVNQSTESHISRLTMCHVDSLPATKKWVTSPNKTCVWPPQKNIESEHGPLSAKGFSELDGEVAIMDFSVCSGQDVVMQKR